MKKASIYPQKQILPATTLSRSHPDCGCDQKQKLTPPSRWSKQRANDWFEKKGGIIGCNYIQSTAGNPLEMWEEGNFDPCVIDQELSWLADSGFNTIRVFLHPWVWMQHSKNYLSRIDWFLSIAEVYGIRVILILFDSAWNLLPKPEKKATTLLSASQTSSGQMPVCQGPRNHSQYEALKDYVQGVVSYLKNDERILLWDLLDLNEPGNMNLTGCGNISFSRYQPEPALRFLKKTLDWVRRSGPVQPITMAPFPKADRMSWSVLDDYMFHHADIISCHTISNKNKREKIMNALKAFGRPIICTDHPAHYLY